MAKLKAWNRKIKIHEFAQMLPEIPKLEYEAIKHDIAENGLQEPIVIFEGKVLDGRHRYRACCELDAQELLLSPPEFRPFKGTPAEAKLFVASLNMHRRHLTKSQRAMILVTSNLVAPSPADGSRRKPGTGRDAIMEVGRKYGVNHMTLYKAAFVHARDAKLAERVLKGEISVSAAEKTIRDREASPVVEQGPQQARRSRLIEKMRTMDSLLRKTLAGLQDPRKVWEVSTKTIFQLDLAFHEIEQLIVDNFPGRSS